MLSDALAGACCACIKVLNEKLYERPGLVIGERWMCPVCRSEFVRMSEANALRARVAELEAENARLRDNLATTQARLKQYRDEDAPYRREENERICEQERDMRDAYFQGRADAEEAHFHDQQGGW